MLPIKATKTKEQWKGVKEFPGTAGEDNLTWLSRATETLVTLFDQPVKAEDLVRLVLLGGVDPVSFRLRVAQAHLRHDLTPSNWSHVVLLHPTLRWRIYEISLQPRGGFRYPVPRNGLQQGDFQTYTAVESYPNIALVGIPTGDKLTWRQMVPTFKAFQKQRTSLDAIELIIRWLAFGWGAGRAGNPLLEGFGIPSSAMLETVFSALGHDLTPGLESRSSCPEALWQAIKWWHGYYGEEGRLQPRCLYRVDHRLVPSPRPRQAQGPKQGQSAS